MDELPGSDDAEFWAEADVHTGIEPKVHFLDQVHFFIRTRGHQAQCNHCWWGFELEPGDKVVEGHLIARGGKLVI